MKSESEKLRELMRDYARAEDDGSGAAAGEHLRDEDFIRLTAIESTAEVRLSPEGNGDLSGDAARPDELAPLREHLVRCPVCLAEFKNFYDFFAPAETGETFADTSEIARAWQSFAPRIAGDKKRSKIWASPFPGERKFNFSAALGWSFAALLLVLTAIGFYIAQQTAFENSQLAARLENQKQTFEERLKTLEQSNRQLEQPDGGDTAVQEKTRLEAEKADLQKQIARLQIEIRRAEQPRRTTGSVTNGTPANPKDASAQNTDDVLVAVNTPIYDVFPADSVVRGGEQAENKFVIPNRAKNVVLILNAAGRAEFSVYRIEIVNASGKIVWRGGGLRKDGNGNFTLTLSKSVLKTGNYRLKLSGAEKSGAQPVAEYAVTVDFK